MKRADKYFLPLECFLFLSEIIKQLILTFVLNSGRYNWWYFPFQLCSLPMYLLPIYLHSGIPCNRNKAPLDLQSDTSCTPKSVYVRQILLTFFMTYNLLGGIAVFFDTSGMYYPLAILTVHSYLWHVLLILLGMYSGYLLLHSTHLSWMLFLKSTLLYGISCLIAEFLNLSVSPYGNINMFYINPRFRMEQVFFCKIADRLGNFTGIVSYLLGTVFGAMLLFLAWRALENHLSLNHETS